jgi:hypothetical protein
MDKLDHVLSNGYTFLAVTTGYYGSWAKATDPMTAIRNAADEAGYGDKKKVAVMCVYGKHGSVYCGAGGGIMWEDDQAPTPIGLFTVTPKAITATKKGDINDLHEDCVEWIEKVLSDIEESRRTEAA